MSLKAKDTRKGKEIYAKISLIELVKGLVFNSTHILRCVRRTTVDNVQGISVAWTLPSIKVPDCNHEVHYIYDHMYDHL